MYVVNKDFRDWQHMHKKNIAQMVSNSLSNERDIARETVVYNIIAHYRPTEALDRRFAVYSITGKHPRDFDDYAHFRTVAVARAGEGSVSLVWSLRYMDVAYESVTHVPARNLSIISAEVLTAGTDEACELRCNEMLAALCIMGSYVLQPYVRVDEKRSRSRSLSSGSSSGSSGSDSG